MAMHVSSFKNEHLPPKDDSVGMTVRLWVIMRHKHEYFAADSQVTHSQNHCRLWANTALV